MKVPLLKGSDGKESVSFTMLIISFAVITFWLIVSIVENIAGIHIRPFDATTAMAYFTPMAMLYFSRKTWTGAAVDVIKRGGINDSAIGSHDGTSPSLPPDANHDENVDEENTPTARPPAR